MPTGAEHGNTQICRRAGPVLFARYRWRESKSKGRYKVVRQLPETGNMLQYRIKSEADGQERVVREDQIEWRR